jgi:hypothetical protein
MRITERQGECAAGVRGLGSGLGVGSCSSMWQQHVVRAEGVRVAGLGIGLVARLGFGGCGRVPMSCSAARPV